MTGKLLLSLLFLITIIHGSSLERQFKICKHTDEDIHYRIFIEGNELSNEFVENESVNLDSIRENFTSCLLQEAKKINLTELPPRTLINHFTMAPYHLDIVENVNDHECFSRPASEGFGPKRLINMDYCRVVRIRFDSNEWKIRQSSYVRLCEIVNSNKLIIGCLQHLPISQLPKTQPTSSLDSARHEQVHVSRTRKVISMNEGETVHLPLLVQVPTNGTCFNLQVTWYHTSNIIEQHTSEEIHMTKLVKEKEWLHCGMATNESLTLHHVTVMDSGEYNALVTKSATTYLIGDEVYQLKVISKTMDMALYVKDMHTGENKNPQFLEKDAQYRFLCSAIGYPFPELTLVFTSPCENQNGNKVQMSNNFTTVSGTFRRVVYADVRVVNNGVVTCLANNNQSLVQQYIVTDKEAGEAVLWATTIEPREPERVMVGDNVTIMVTVQKQFTSLRCYQNFRNCGYKNETCFGFHCMETTYSNCPKVVDAIAQNTSTCLQLASSWRSNVHDFEVDIDDSDSFSNKFYVHVRNVSAGRDRFHMYCFGNIGDSLDGPTVLSFTVDSEWPEAPFFHIVPSLRKSSYQYTDFIWVSCAAFGWPPPVVAWIHNGQTVNITNVPYKKRVPDFLRETSLLFEIKKETDYGEYCCEISNKFGRNSTCITVSP